MRTRIKPSWDDFILGGMAAMTGIIALSCVAYFFNLGSMQTALMRVMG